MKTVRTKMFCACGRRMSKYARACRACHRAVALEAVRRYVAAAKAGTCPHHPGHPLVFNNSLASSMWLQCLYPHATASACIAASHARSRGAVERSCAYQVLCGRDEYREVTGEATP